MMNFNFLEEIKTVVDLNENQRKFTGEDFNIFSIMTMESDEVYLHSALIAELLNPKGTHSLGSKPLEIFVKKFLKPEFTFECENAFSTKEEHIGFKNEDNSEGGRIDIIVKDISGNIFIIENKIYAAEQINQLERYKKHYPLAELFYLTLDGKESEQAVLDDSNEKKYSNLSYENNIKEWIEECIVLSQEKPMLRETLNQYLYLIKKLTNQSTNIAMSKEIRNIISENLEASFEIYKNFDAVLHNLQENMLIKLSEDIKSKQSELNIELKDYKDDLAIYINKNGNADTLIFRFKNRKFPVFVVNNIGLNSAVLKMSDYKSDKNDKSKSVLWKFLPTVSSTDFFPENAVNKQVYFRNEIEKEAIKLFDLMAEK